MSFLVFDVRDKLIGVDCKILDYILIEARPKKKGKWGYFGDMMWEYSGSKSSGHERSVIYDCDLHKKPRTHKKPRLFYQDECYSWRLEREVLLDLGDYLFIAEEHTDIDDEGTIHTYRVLSVMQVKSITMREGRNCAVVKFAEIISWDSRLSSHALSEVLEPEFLEVAEKAFKFKKREPYWFKHKKYTIEESL